MSLINKLNHYLKMTSINSKMILGAISIVTSSTLLTGYTLGTTFYNSAYSALKDSLTGQIYLLMADREFITSSLYSDSPILSNSQLPNSKSNRHQSYSHLSGFITQKNGTILWQSAPDIKTLLPPVTIFSKSKIEHGKKIFQQYEVNGKSYISLSIAIFWNLESEKFPLIYHISDNLSHLDKKIADYQNSLWTNLIIMSLLLFITFFLILRWGLKPLRDVEQEIKSVEQGKQELLVKTYPDEITPLTQNINQLIQFERHQQFRYRNALADLAHSLKTPLAIIQGQIQNSDLSDNNASDISDSIVRMNSIVEYQLQRAASTTPAPHIQYLQLTPVIHTLINSMKKIYHDKNIHYQLDLGSAIQFKIDEGDFMEILGNLLDNACKWCKNEIELSVTTNNSSLHIRVADNGPGIPTEIINDVTKRGVRADQLTPGHGVGLSIVQDIIDVYDGEIEFKNSKKGGLEININFNGIGV